MLRGGHPRLSDGVRILRLLKHVTQEDKGSRTEDKLKNAITLIQH